MGRRSRRTRSNRAERWQGAAPLRLLVGPYVHACHCEYMAGAFDDYDAITFGAWEGADVVIDGFYSIEDVLERLPSDWRPDLMLLWRPEYTMLPRGLERVDFPVAMLISDWYVAFTACLEAARFVNLVITGTRGERVYRTAGFDNVVALPMLGYQQGLDGAFNQTLRDIDVFCAGNPTWTVHREREQVNAKLLELPPHVRLVHAPFVGRDVYNQYLGRSKIFVNQTVIGEINMKVYEVTAAETCLFVEEDNLDVQGVLEPGRSVVLFNRSNLNEKILHYLAHEEERRFIARNGLVAMKARSYRANMVDIVEHLRTIGPEALLGMGREIARASRDRIDTHYITYSLRRTLLDPLGAAVLAEELPPLPGGRHTTLQAMSRYTARARGIAESANDPRWERIPDPDEVIESFREAWKQNEDDLCLNLAWAQLAPHHVPPQQAAPALDRLIEQLRSGVRVPLGGSALYTLPEKRSFVFERIAWEQVERGLPPDDALRAYLLEFAYTLRARFLRSCGERWAAIDALREAVRAYPTGEEPRPLLARDLRDLGEFAEAITVLESHLVQRPLDLVARVSLVELHLRRGQPDRAREQVDAIERQARVFCDEEWLARADRLRLGLPLPSAEGASV